jgi:DNA-binding transcriptional ArsR family regulator
MKSECARIKKDFERNAAVCAKTLDLLHLISNKVRFRIICLLTRGDFCVQDIAGVVGHGNLSNTSQQLKILRLAGLISQRREARRIIYSLTDDRVRDMISYLRKKFLAA